MSSHEWLEESRTLDNQIIALTTAYMDFNPLYTHVETENSRNRAKIKALFDHIPNSKSREIIESHTEAIGVLIERPVINMEHPELDTSGDVACYNRCVSSKSKLKSIFMIIYLIRCNAVHGEKEPHDERDIALCRSSKEIVEDVILYFDSHPIQNSQQ